MSEAAARRAGCRPGECRRGGDITCAPGGCDIADGVITDAEAAAARALDVVRARHDRTRGAVLDQARTIGVASPHSFARWDMGADRLTLRRGPTPMTDFVDRLRTLISAAERAGVPAGRIADELRRAAGTAEGQGELT